MSGERDRRRDAALDDSRLRRNTESGQGSRLTLPDRISIADGPLRTSTPGQWRLFLSATPPAAFWRATLLELAALTPPARKLQLSFDRRALVFRCDDNEHALLGAIREIGRLIEETNRRSDRPETRATEELGT